MVLWTGLADWLCVCTAASRAATEATVGWSPSRDGAKPESGGAPFPWTHCHCGCLQTLAPQAAWPASLISIFFVLGLNCSYFCFRGNLCAFTSERLVFPFHQPRQRRPQPWKAPAPALSLHVSAGLSNQTCLGTAPLTGLMFWTSCSCHFLSHKPWCWSRVTVSNCPGRRGRKNLLDGARRDCWCVTQTIHQMFV